MTFWRTAGGAEVDLVMGEADVALEIKSSENVTRQPKGLHLFHEENPCKKRIIVCREPVARKTETGIWILPCQRFCEMLGAGEIL